MAQMSGLKPCPFCGGGAILIIEPVVLSRCVWVECSECRVTSPMIEFKAEKDIDPLCSQLGEARRMAQEFWNTRAHDHELQSG